MSGKNKKVDRELEQQKIAALNQQNAAYAELAKPTPEMLRYREEQAAWDKFMKSKDYSKPPGYLDFQLGGAARAQEQTARMADLQGVGALNMGGDDSTALQLAKQHQAASAGQNAAQAYEDAIGREQAYFRGAAPTYMQSDVGKWGSIYGQASSNLGHTTDMWMQNQNRPSPWLGVLGSALGMAGSLFAGKFGK